MSAPLLLWLVLLHGATAGGPVRGGRTWRHCTGRSAGRRGLCRRVASTPALGQMPRPVCDGMSQKACYVLGGTQGSGGLGLRMTAPRDAPRCVAGGGDVRAPAAPGTAQERCRGDSCVPASAAQAPFRALLAPGAGMWGAEGLEEVEQSSELPGGPCAPPGTTSTLQAAKPPRKFPPQHPPPRSCSSHGISRGEAPRAARAGEGPHPGALPIPWLCHEFRAWTVTLQPRFWGAWAQAPYAWGLSQFDGTCIYMLLQPR